MPVIGYLAAGSPDAFASRLDALRRGLGDYGYAEGRNVAIEPRWASGVSDQLQAFAADLVARKVDVIVALGPPSLRAAAAATSTIPVVFVVGSDPVRDRLVASMSRPECVFHSQPELKSIPACRRRHTRDPHMPPQ